MFFGLYGRSVRDEGGETWWVGEGVINDHGVEKSVEGGGVRWVKDFEGKRMNGVG